MNEPLNHPVNAAISLVEENPPTEFRLPHRCSADRLRARRATLALQREIYQLTRDNLVGHPDEGFRLPPRQVELPSQERFSLVKAAGVALRRERTRFNRWVSAPRDLLSLGPSEARFLRRLPLLDLPSVARRQPYRWDQDVEFGRQRLAGVNPLELRICTEIPAQLRQAAEQVLGQNGSTVDQAMAEKRLYQTSYPLVADARVQISATRRGQVLAAPTCLFWSDRAGDLIPLAIQLRPSGTGTNPVFTPLGNHASWMLARAHAQAADAHYHEAISHLLRTHLVNEVFIVCTRRHLHPDHPIAQLLEPHCWYTLAINVTARGHLLSGGGPMDTAMAAGVPGVLDLARLAFQGWSFFAQNPLQDLAERGVYNREALPNYPYRDDVEQLWGALLAYTQDIVGIWYPSEDDIKLDDELQSWARELAAGYGGALPGFPSPIASREQLAEALAIIIHLTSVAHAAVNNGQFDQYGFTPNAPGMVRGPLPEIAYGRGEGPGMKEFWRALPGRDITLAQASMAWVLSEPTRLNLFGAGDVPAFQEEVSPASRAAVATLRRRLAGIAEKIEARNATLPVAYTYLEPTNIGCSTEL